MNWKGCGRQRGGALVNLLLLLCVVALAAGGWAGWQEWQRWQSMSQDRDARLTRLQQELQSLRDTRDQQSAQLAELQGKVTDAGAALDDLRAGGQRDWLLNESAALAGLAQQRLLLTGDIEAADRLLAAADRVLSRAEDAALLNARRALARDRQALEAARQVDVNGLVLKLAALQQRVADLTLVGVPRTLQETVADAPATDDGWWQQLLARMPVQVREHDRPVPLPLDAAEASLLRLALNALLEQAQLALLQGRAEIYRAALEQAQRVLDDRFAEDHPVAAELRQSLRGLQDTPVEQALPDIGAGLQALKQLQEGARS